MTVDAVLLRGSHHRGPEVSLAPACVGVVVRGSTQITNIYDQQCVNRECQVCAD